MRAQVVSTIYDNSYNNNNYCSMQEQYLDFFGHFLKGYKVTEFFHVTF